MQGIQCRSVSLPKLAGGFSDAHLPRGFTAHTPVASMQRFVCVKVHQPFLQKGTSASFVLYFLSTCFCNGPFAISVNCLLIFFPSLWGCSLFMILRTLLITSCVSKTPPPVCSAYIFDVFCCV